MTKSIGGQDEDIRPLGLVEAVLFVMSDPTYSDSRTQQVRWRTLGPRLRRRPEVSAGNARLGFLYYTPPVYGTYGPRAAQVAITVILSVPSSLDELGFVDVNRKRGGVPTKASGWCVNDRASGKTCALTHKR